MPAQAFDRPGKKVELNKIAVLPPSKMTKEKAVHQLQQLGQELFDLQDLMFGAKMHSLLVVLQGRDSAGKDGTIKNVVGSFNPRGVHVVSFGVPTKEELDHDFLWRIHRQTPGRGEVTIFNRSHYEDVLVVRVHDLVPKKVWQQRFEMINSFEKALAERDTIVLKFFLHIDPEEQEKRLLDREKDATKAWKLNVEDWKERTLWKEYTLANQDAISRCATPHAPWFIVPANKKWYRNLVVAQAIVEALRPHRSAWLQCLKKQGKQAKAELAASRQEQ